MICPYCHHEDNFVLETRQNSQGQLRRRRQCSGCQGKFTTLEKVWLAKVMIKKRDGSRELFNRNKVSKGIELALKKREASIELIDEMVDRIEKLVYEKGVAVVESSEVGQLVMNELKVVDKVAYLRFTSVCNDFESIKHFKQEMEKL